MSQRLEYAKEIMCRPWEGLSWAFMFKISLYLCEVHMATDIPITNYLPQ